jgi:glycosyltransferase involved in cell wall biosynthesis
MSGDHKTINIVFLYTELAGYVITCLETLGRKNDVNVTVIHWPVKSEAPFELPVDGPFDLVSRSNLSREDIENRISDLAPNGIFVSGWMDEDYLAIARKYINTIPVVLTMDNKWKGTLRQRLVALSSSLFVKNHFNLAWVPGEDQKKFALKLGFHNSEISSGFYSADTEKFNRMCIVRSNTERNTKKLLYVGRYVEQKGLELLWEAFLSLHRNNPRWELHCVGTGEGYDSRMQHPNIFHYGFLQPTELERLIVEATAFVMPSLLEPWGVVLHEMAAAGLPLISSDAVGAASTFVEDGVNGWSYSHSNQLGLKSSLEKLYFADDHDLFKMGKESYRISKRISPEVWAETAEKIVVLKQTHSK